MDINYELGGLKFVWDSDKAKINLKKHRISFKLTVRVFFDENNFDDYDELHSEFEERYKIIGKVDKILVVIYTERLEKIRIISARYATKREERDYYAQF